MSTVVEKVRLTKEEAAARGFRTEKKLRKPQLQRSNCKYQRKVSVIHKLRVNIKSLVGESRIIRVEEKRCGIAYESELRNHRIHDVRFETRAALLALAIVRGRKFKQVEDHGPNWYSFMLANRIAEKLLATLGMFELLRLYGIAFDPLHSPKTNVGEFVKKWMLDY